MATAASSDRLRELAADTTDCLHGPSGSLEQTKAQYCVDTQSGEHGLVQRATYLVDDDLAGIKQGRNKA